MVDEKYILLTVFMGNLILVRNRSSRVIDISTTHDTTFGRASRAGGEYDYVGCIVVLVPI